MRNFIFCSVLNISIRSHTPDKACYHIFYRKTRAFELINTYSQTVFAFGHVFLDDGVPLEHVDSSHDIFKVIFEGVAADGRLQGELGILQHLCGLLLGGKVDRFATRWTRHYELDVFLCVNK